MNKLKVSNWNNYPQIEATIWDVSKSSNRISVDDNVKNLIARGAGKSYGDASLNENILSTLAWNDILDFDIQNQTITVESGILIDTILSTIVPNGLFLPVVPGTKFITIGGAIAADVHGKNHIKNGSFSKWVQEFILINHQNEIIICSRTENADLFYASFGGMGLTGIVYSAKIKLIELPSSYILEKQQKIKSLTELLKKFNENKEEYAVAWIDVYSNSLPSILHTGHFIEQANFKSIPITNPKHSFVFSIPFYMPSGFINKGLIKLYNAFKRSLTKSEEETKLVFYDTFLFPLDKIKNWNRLYGKSGFLQYQFAVPEEHALICLEEIFHKIKKSNECVSLCTLKRMSEADSNIPMQFAIKGYTIAIDFKISNTLVELLDQLDTILLKFSGLIYLAKDARMKSKVFHKMYKKTKTGDKYFSSILARRLKME